MQLAATAGYGIAESQKDNILADADRDVPFIERGSSLTIGGIVGNDQGEVCLLEAVDECRVRWRRADGA